MTIFSRNAALAAVLLTSVALPAAAEPVFNRIASFPVASNLPADKDKLSTTSAEIIAATDDGMTLIYSDSPLGAIGFVDISDAKAPKAGGALMMDGEPTSVTSASGKALVAVNTSEEQGQAVGQPEDRRYRLEEDRGQLRSRWPAGFDRAEQGQDARCDRHRKRA
jgi:hypothetical protein